MDGGPVVIEGYTGSHYQAACVPSGWVDRVCTTCRAPVSPGYERCRPCTTAPEQAVPACAGFVIYAIKDAQSGTDMHRYKSTPPSVSAIVAARGMVRRAFDHLDCLERITGRAVDTLAVVPSRSHYQAGKPSTLQSLVESQAPINLPLCSLTPSSSTPHKDRVVKPDVFVVKGNGEHVLVIDDTWVSGASIMSAVWSLHQAGSPTVSTLCLARWLDPGFSATQPFITQMDQAQAWVTLPDKKCCPYTATGVCPAPSIGSLPG